MELSLAERFTIQQFLPEKGNLMTLKIVETLRMALSVTEEEVKEYEIVMDDNGIKWNRNKEKTKDIEIGGTSISLIKSALKELDGKSELTLQFLPIMEKLGIDSFNDENDTMPKTLTE